MSELTASEFLKKRKSKSNAVSEIQENYKTAEAHLRSTGKIDIWEDIFKYYHGYLKGKMTNNLVPNFHLHKIFPAIETSAARFALAYFSSSPFISVDARSKDSVDSAPKLEGTIQYYLEHAPDFYFSTMRLIKYTQMYGAAFRVPSWKRERRMVTRNVPAYMDTILIGHDKVEQEEIVYEGLTFTTYSPSEVFVDPMAQQYGKARRVIVEQFVPIEDLVRDAEQGKYDLGKVNQIPMNASGQDKIPYFERLGAIGQGQPEADVGIVRLWHQLEADNIKTLANETTLIRDIPNPLELKRIPCVMASHIMDVDSLYPMSQGELMLPSQKMTNLLINGMIQTILNSLHPVWKYRTKIDPNFLVSLPNHKIPVSNMEDVDIIKMPEMKSDIFSLFSVLQSGFEEMLGLFGPQKGYGSKVQSATSDAIFQQEGNKRIEFDTMTFERNTLIPEAELVSALILQNMSAESAVKISGPGGEEFANYDPEELRGSYKYKVGGASQSIARSLIHQKLTEMYAISSEAMQYVRTPTGELVPVPVLDVYEAMKELYRSTGHKDIEKILYRPEVFGIPVDNEMFKQFGLGELPDNVDNMEIDPETKAKIGASLQLPNQNNVDSANVINMPRGRAANNKRVNRDIVSAI